MLREIAAASRKKSEYETAVVLTTATGVPLSGTWLMPDGAPKGTTLYLYAAGATKAVDNADVKALVDAGQAVLAFDVSGIGTTAPQGRRWYSESFGVNAGNAVVAYLCGSSMVAQRTEEILATAKLFATGKGGNGSPNGVSLVATDELCVSALHAAAIAPDLISKTKLIRPLISWTEVIRGKLTQNQVVNAVQRRVARVRPAGPGEVSG